MEKVLYQQLNHIKSHWFIIHDEQKVIWYLRWVWYFRLRRYFNIFEDKNRDFQEVINCYLFDKNLRFLNLNIIESIEIFIKNLFILNFWENYNDWWIYDERYVLQRLKFIDEKILELSKKDRQVQKILDNSRTLNGEVFINKLTFWEIIRCFQDLKKEHKLLLSQIIWIKLTLLENWLDCLVYLRNLCSHWENIFNKKMLKSIEWKKIFELFWSENNNRFIAYFSVISIFKESLIPNYNWEEKVFIKMKQYNINFSDFWQKKETFPNELDSEAWKVLVQPLYEKYIKKSNKNIK
jgi:abortive infection bacteriophage resistance protein